MDADARLLHSERALEGIMADQKPRADEKKDAAESAPAPAKTGGRKIMLIIGGIMLLEGAGIFGAMKLVGAGPGSSHADELTLATQPSKRSIEIEVVRVRTPNDKEGKLILWSLEVVIRVPADQQQSVADVIKANSGTIKDRIARLIRAASPEHLREPGLETLRRQMRFELGRVLEDESKILEVLIPDCTPYPTGF